MSKCTHSRGKSTQSNDCRCAQAWISFPRPCSCTTCDLGKCNYDARQRANGARTFRVLLALKTGNQCTFS